MKEKKEVRYDKEDSSKCSDMCDYKSKVGNKCNKYKVKLDGINYMTSPYSGGRDNYRCKKCLKLRNAKAR